MERFTEYHAGVPVILDKGEERRVAAAKRFAELEELATPKKVSMTTEEMRQKLEELTGKKIEVESNRRVGQWFLLDECSNSGVYCSICGKKVYKEDYANQKIKSKFCPNCGAIMEC